MSKKVVVFGSVNVDVFFDVTDLNFLTQTGPGAEDGLHLLTHKQAPGGKGANQAVAAAKAGAKVHFYGALGRGAHGRFLIENFKKIGINVSGLHQDEAPTGMAVIFNKPNGKHKMVVSHGANMIAKAKQVPDTLLKKNSILVLQAETDLRQNAALMRRAKKNGAQIIYNIAPAAEIPEKDLKLVDFLILNEAEAVVVAKHCGMKSTDPYKLAKEMAHRFKLMCLITCGEKGLVACDTEIDFPVSLPALPVKAIDSVGAGDAFVGAFAAALAENNEPWEALHYGIVAGSLACTRLGAQAALPKAKDIQKHLPKLAQAIRKNQKNDLRKK